MKLNTSNTYDVSQVSNFNSYKELETFFDYINSFSSEVVQAFNKRITLKDNLQYVEIPLTIQHGTPVNIGKYNPLAVFIQSEQPYIGFKLSTQADSTKNFSVFFKNAQYIRATSAIWIAGTITRYKVDSVAPYSVGDPVIVSGFGTANNNGTFPIVEIDSTDNYLYLNNRKRTSATGDESKTTYVGSPLLSYPITLGFITG